MMIISNSKQKHTINPYVIKHTMALVTTPHIVPLSKERAFSHFLGRKETDYSSIDTLPENPDSAISSIHPGVTFQSDISNANEIQKFPLVIRPFSENCTFGGPKIPECKLLGEENISAGDSKFSGEKSLTPASKKLSMIDRGVSASGIEVSYKAVCDHTHSSKSKCVLAKPNILSLIRNVPTVCTFSNRDFVNDDTLDPPSKNMGQAVHSVSEPRMKSHKNESLTKNSTSSKIISSSQEKKEDLVPNHSSSIPLKSLLHHRKLINSIPFSFKRIQRILSSGGKNSSVDGCYKNLISSLDCIRKPNNRWQINQMTNHILCCKWNDKSEPIIKVVINNKMQISIFLKDNRTTEMMNNLVVRNVTDVSTLLRKVDKLNIEETCYRFQRETSKEDDSLSSQLFAAPKSQFSQKVINRNEQPPYSYAQLIIQAISSSSEKKLSLKGIYSFLENAYPYFRDVLFMSLTRPQWQNAIRHCLSVNPYFEKVPKTSEHKGKGSLWQIRPKLESQLLQMAYTKKGRQNTPFVESESPTPPTKKANLVRLKSCDLTSPLWNRTDICDIHIPNSVSTFLEGDLQKTFDDSLENIFLDPSIDIEAYIAQLNVPSDEKDIDLNFIEKCEYIPERICEDSNE